MSSNREQISVPLDRELRDFVERTAERETRTLAGQIRHWVEAERQRAALGDSSIGAVA
jgi:hypothetical protein